MKQLILFLQNSEDTKQNIEYLDIDPFQYLNQNERIKRDHKMFLSHLFPTSLHYFFCQFLKSTFRKSIWTAHQGALQNLGRKHFSACVANATVILKMYNVYFIQTPSGHYTTFSGKKNCRKVVLKDPLLEIHSEWSPAERGQIQLLLRMCKSCSCFFSKAAFTSQL